MASLFLGAAGKGIEGVTAIGFGVSILECENFMELYSDDGFTNL